MRAIKCCYKCEERHVGCHSTCERYIEESKVIEKQRKEHLEKLNRDAHIYASMNRKRRNKK